MHDLPLFEPHNWVASDSMAMLKWAQARATGNVQRRAAPLPIADQAGGVRVIEVRGVLVRQSQWSDEVGTDELAAQMRAAAADPDVRAIVLAIDSPGGAVAAMPNLVAAAKEAAAAKPLLAHVDDYCCSAAYELACWCTAIYASPRTTVGSIGTRILLYDFSRLFEKEGIEAVAIDTGEFKSLGALGTPITETHREYLAELVADAQQDFEEAVRQGRGLSAEQYAAVANGKVWWADKALALNLIDGVQVFAATIQAAVAATTPATISARGKETMSEAPVVPAVATHKELKEALPGASADFILEQLEANATLSQAQAAWCKNLAEANAKLAAEKAEAEAKAAAAEAKSQAPPAAPQRKRGNPSVASGAGDAGEQQEQTDWRAMAEAIRKEKGCRWSEACMEVKRRFPESREFFNAPKA